MKKILFNDEFLLTKAVLDGRKTQTRRVCKEQVWSHSDLVNAENGIFHFEIPKYEVSETIAVAQSYRDCGGVNECGVPMWEVISQKVGGTNAGWNNKMFVRAEFMPHQIRITDVRVERLQDISEEDAIAEGITYAGLFYEDYGEPMFIIEGCKQAFGSAKDAYAWLIDKISGKGTWQSNPYVFVYDFELIK